MVDQLLPDVVAMRSAPPYSLMLYWLSILPLIAAAIIHVGRRQRSLVIGLGLATNLACAGLLIAQPLDSVVVYLGQQWALNSAAQAVLLLIYISTAILLLLAATTEQSESLYAPMLASTGLLAAAILLRSLLSWILLPTALLVLVFAASPMNASTVRGASRFLVLITLPILSILATFVLLQRFPLFPDELALAKLAALLVLPPILLWLTLFPFQGTTCLWAKEGCVLTPAFLWAAKDWGVIYLLLTLWQQYPVLYTHSAAAILSAVGLTTAVISGVLAFRQSSAFAVLACAAMSELGIVLQGLTTRSGQGLYSSLMLLINRSVAVLLAASALTALHSIAAGDTEGSTSSTRWQRLLALIAFAVGVLALAGIPPFAGFSARRYIYGTLQTEGPYMLLAWSSASAGIVLGLVRTVRSLWQMKVRPPSKYAPGLLLLLIACLLLVCLGIGLHPRGTLGLLQHLLPFSMPSPQTVTL